MWWGGWGLKFLDMVLTDEVWMRSADKVVSHIDASELLQVLPTSCGPRALLQEFGLKIGLELRAKLIVILGCLDNNTEGL